MAGLDITGIEVSFKGYDSYDEMIASLGTDEIDVAFPVGGGMYYSEESGIFQSSPVVSAATELVHKGEYAEKTITHFAVNEKNRMQYYFVKTYYPEAQITFYPSIDECLKSVRKGKTGCTTLNGLRANNILKNTRYKGLSLLQTTHDDDRCFGVPQCKEKGLVYEYKVLNEVSDYYIGDDTKLKQVIINILSNAIKFTDAPGNVLMTVERTALYGDHSTLKFCIKDTGIGMDKSFIPKIFDVFAQEDSSRNTKYGSTGLGMAITKNIVELMNGTISVESEKGKGTEVTVVISLTNCEHQTTSAPTQTAEEKNHVELKGKHILMAEDVDINAEIMEQLITMREATIDRAENGKRAVEMFEKSTEGYYDAILMDVRMPEMDGLEATATIRALERPDAKTVPIIAMTANAFDEDVQRSLQVGMNAHLSKPVEPELLYNTLEEYIKK